MADGKPVINDGTLWGKIGGSVIRLTGVTKTYTTGNRVLEQVNLDIKKGDFVYVVGGSGAGKTTLLKLLSTEEAPTTGSITLFGYSLFAQGKSSARRDQIQMIRRAIGYIPQQPKLIGDLSVYDNLSISVDLAGRASAQNAPKSKIHEILEKLGLTHRLKTRADRLSGGEAQRVAVARALVRQPDLLIADEPTGSQDNDHTWAMMELFSNLNQAGATLLVATHDREIIRRVRKRCVWLQSGQLVVESGVKTWS